MQLGPGKNYVWFGNRKKISQIIKDYFYLPFFLLIILWMRRTYKAIHRVVSRAGYMGPVLWGSESCLFSLYHLMEWKSPQLAWFTAHLNRREPSQEAKALRGFSRGWARTGWKGCHGGWAIESREGRGGWERTAGGVVTGLSFRAAGRSWGERAAGRVVTGLSYRAARRSWGWERDAGWVVTGLWYTDLR